MHCYKAVKGRIYGMMKILIGVRCRSIDMRLDVCGYCFMSD